MPCPATLRSPHSRRPQIFWRGPNNGGSFKWKEEEPPDQASVCFNLLDTIITTTTSQREPECEPFSASQSCRNVSQHSKCPQCGPVQGRLQQVSIYFCAIQNCPSSWSWSWSCLVLLLLCCLHRPSSQPTLSFPNGYPCNHFLSTIRYVAHYTPPISQHLTPRYTIK